MLTFRKVGACVNGFMAVSVYLMIPGLLIASLGIFLSASAVIRNLETERFPLVVYSDNRYDRNLDVRVPFEFWER